MTTPTGWPHGDLESRVRFAVEEVRPALQADGGDVRLVRVEGSTAVVELHGACDGCPMAHSTLAEFVAERICLYAPEIEKVVAE
ncbi:MAG: NifU family protein [Thermoanaerobaculales bacterium]|jgi:Fe-S cluster biogenesis protein NfuA|nr:NifU family protein [Thermoanaerobaculales bacterium]